MLPEFAVLPPEINSARMYGGPRSASMWVAAAAWDQLGAQLGWAASAFESTVSGLTAAGWLGPSSLSMSAAAAPYVAWLSAAASQAELVANQSRVSAGAFDAAFAATVPPPEIAANRALLMALIATNFLGQNTPAIAATEAQYAEMWAQDVAAMVGYDAGTSVTAAQSETFSAPPPIGAGASQLMSTLPTAAFSWLPALTTPVAIGPTAMLASPLAAGAGASVSSSAPAAGASLAASGQDVAVSLEDVEEPVVSTGLGQANSIGALSVPPGWQPQSPSSPTPTGPSVDPGQGSNSLPRIPRLPRMNMAGLRGAGFKVGVAASVAAGISKAGTSEVDAATSKDADAETPLDAGEDAGDEPPEGTAPHRVGG